MSVPTYPTFEELIAAAQAQGATHVTMGNYHDGAFWKYKALSRFPLSGSKHSPWRDPLKYKEVMLGILHGANYQKRVTHIAWFNAGGPHGTGCSYHDWVMTAWTETFGDEMNSQFIPIEQAADWYRNWNKHYTP